MYQRTDPGAKYKITGVNVYGQRFRFFTDSGIHAAGINLYRGHVWMRVDGRWRIVKSVWN